MKNKLMIIVLMISFSAMGATNHHINNHYKFPSDTTVLPQILGLPLSSYIGKPVDSLLSALPPGYSSRNFMPVGAGYAKGIFQAYAGSWENNCAIEIYIDTFQHLPVPNRTVLANWNMNLAKMEKIAFIKVYKNNTICLYGCGDPRYYNY